jgi:hypothetical protein
MTDDKDFLKSLVSYEFYEYLRNNIIEIQKRYARGIMDIVGWLSTEETIKEFWSKIEVLPLVDENDTYYRNTAGFWASEFRQDYTNYQILPESRERAIFCRVTLFIIEDINGNIIVSRRGSKKSHPNMLEVPWGHVSVGYGYLETCIKEMDEELKYVPESISESDRLFKFRNIVPISEPWTQGRGNIIVVYKIQVPWVDFLSPDKNEISEFVAMRPEELLASIGNQNDSSRFDPNHAYLYLEYLKTGLSKNIRSIESEQQKLRHTLTKIDTFSIGEKSNK